MFSAIPTNIITGFLGAGKTTAITALLKQRPEGENWAVLVNEFGEVSIDQALLGDSGEERDLGDGVTVRDLPGGCLCCTMGVPFQVALNKLVKDSNPDRIIIEPTGLGHPAQLIESLLQPPFDVVLDLRAVVCLIDPDRFAEPRVQTNEVFIDQLMAADVVVFSKTDLATKDNIDGARAGVGGIFPPKLAIEIADNGHFDIALLDLARQDGRKMLYPEFHGDNDQHDHDHGHHHYDHDKEKGGDMQVFPSTDDKVKSCGWIIDRDVIFDHDKLLDFAGGQNLPEGTDRFKGAFHTGRGWMSVNRAGQAFAFAATSWRRDSRCEIIMEEGAPLDQQAVETLLRSFRLD